MWPNETVYQGNLAEYQYPTDKEVGDFLKFLKQIKNNKRIYLIDVPRWNLALPPTDYDVYVICMFGEAVDERYINKIDNHPDFADKQVILLTSQFYAEPTFNLVRVFYIEHLHTVIPFLPRPTYTKLVSRQFTHGSLSNRNAIHKTVLTAKLLQHFKNDFQYSFCNTQSSEYKNIETVVDILTGLGIKLTHECIDIIHSLHQHPVMVPGGNWAVDNHIYQNSQLIWTTESIFSSNDNGPTAYITEKIIKSIISGSCFVVASQQHTITRLRQLGFETYEKEFNLDYDTKCDYDRYMAIFNLIENFNLDTSSAHVQNIADYNHNYFYSEFYNRVEKDNIDRIEQVIEYINAI